MDIAFGIDEFHYKKGSMKDFCCMILDTITHKVIKILHNNKTATIEKYFASIPVENRLKVRYISADMNYSYISLCEIYFLRATIFIAVDFFNVSPIKILLHQDNTF